MTERFPIVMKAWAGSEAHDFDYIVRSLPSLLKSDLPAGAEIVIFDDASTNPRLEVFLQKVRRDDPRVHVRRHARNLGPNRGQEEAYRVVAAEYPDAPFFVNVDDDVVYHCAWLQRLLEARDALGGCGITGVLSALNMPFRPAFARLAFGGRKYLLKWKQPALNWLIPREVYERAGPFVDEGIAYDTVYSHWLRLHGFPIICLKPSHVQNIGAYGAYSADRTTTARDFVGEGAGCGALRRAGLAVMWQAAAWGRRLQRGRRTGLNTFAPVRWGAELVYEGWVGRDRQPVAYFHADEMARLREVQRVRAEGPYGIRRIHGRAAEGRPIVVECGWRFLPSLRDCRKYPELAPERSRAQSPGELLLALAAALLPFHSAGVSHNKVRLENAYWDAARGALHLAWLGTEPGSGRGPLTGREQAIERFGSALDRWADAPMRETFASRYLATVAPEVLAGEAATPASDVYALAATLVSYLSDEDVTTLARVDDLREEWARGGFRIRPGVRLEPLRGLLEKCLVLDPQRRYRDAFELQKALMAASTSPTPYKGGA